MALRAAQFARWAVAVWTALTAIGRIPVTAAPPSASQPTAAGPAVQFDLTAARFTSLLSESIFDEDANVTAEPGKTFLVMPFLYDPAAGELALSRTGLRGKDAKSVYGFRVLAAKDGALRPDKPDQPIVYERLELAARSGSAPPAVAEPPVLSARNNSPPRKAPADKSKPAPFKPAVDALPATGYAALVLEVAKNAKTVSVEIGGCEESISLDFLRQAGRPIPLVEPREGEDSNTARTPPAVDDILDHVTGGTAAMAALAIDQLAANRRNWPRPETAPWVTGVDITVLTAAGREEPLVRNAAWRYFSFGGVAGQPSPTLTTQVLDYLAAADDALQRQWIHQVELGLALAPGGPAWSRLAPRHVSAHSAPASAVSILSAVLRGEDTAVCADAVDLLLRLDAESSAADWKFLESSSPQAQKLVIERLEKLKDAGSPVRIRRVLTMLLRSPHPDTAPLLARLAANCGFVMDRLDSALATAWQQLKPPEEHTALLTALAGADVRTLVYEDPLASLLRAATIESTADSPAEKRLREAAWNFIIRQARRMSPPLPTTQRTAPRPKGRAHYGAFPLLVSRAARDPIACGLADAARRAARTQRSQALILLLQSGFAEEAARSLADAGTTPAQREVLLKEIVAKGESATGRDAVLAMLGHLLRRDVVQSAPWILNRLRDVRAKLPADQTWRFAAAVKAGINFGELDQLAAALATDGNPASSLALALLQDLCHMTPQDQERLAATVRPDERSALLDRIDLRRAQLVDGRYGVVLVLETMSPAQYEANNGSNQEPDLPKAAAKPAKAGGELRVRRWEIPQRFTVEGPPLTLQSEEEPNSRGDLAFRVLWDSTQIGTGLVINKPKSVGGPGRFSPVLQVADWFALSSGGYAGPSASEASVGPLVLQHRAVVNPLTPGTMTLDIADYLRAAMQSRTDVAVEELDEMLSKTCPITLRYAPFGSYYGCAPDQPSPNANEAPPRRRLLGIMMILEKMD